MADEKKQAPDKAAEKAAEKERQRQQKEAQAKAKQEAAAKAKSQKEEQAKAKQEAAAQAKSQKEEQAKAKRAAKEASAQEAAEKKGKKEKPPKLSKKEKKALKQQAEEAGAEDAKKEKKYKPKGLFWRIFGICLAFFMGIFSSLGGVAAAIAILLTGPSRDLLSQFNLNAEDFISQEYLDKSIFDLYDDVRKDLNLLADPANLTLETFSKYTPLLDTYLNDFIDQNLKDLGINLDLNSIKQQKFSELGKYAKTELLPQVELGPLLELDTDVTLEKVKSNAPMYALCYGRIGVDYDVENNAVVMKEGKKPKNITDLVPTLKADSGEAPQVSPTAAEEGEGGSSDGMLDILGGIELGSFLGLDIRLNSEEEQNNGMLYAMCYGTEDVDFTFEDREGGKILKMIGDSKATTVTDLIDNSDEFINGISLGSLLGLEEADSLANRSSNTMMYTLCYGTEGVDWDIVDGKLKMREGHEAVTIGKLTQDSNAVVDGLPLGEMLGLNTEEELANRENNAMMYTLCYGTEGVDWEIDPDTNLIKMLGGKEAVTLGKLTQDSNAVMDDLSLGEMLGLNSAEELAKRDENSMMYAICYGTEGVDWEVNEEGKLQMLGDSTPITLGELTKNSGDVIDGLYVDVILGIKPGSDAIMRTVAYGNEARKGNTDKGDLVDQYGYLVDEEGKYPTEYVLGDDGLPTTTKQYVGGGKYVIQGEGEEAEVVMLPDPNDPEGKPYAKKTVGDLTAEDANLLDGVTLGSLLDIQEGDSGIMVAMKDWTIDDLQDQDKIESLKLGDVLKLDTAEDAEMPEGTSKIMWTLRTKTIQELNEQETIDNLKLGDVLDIDEDDPTTSKILIALQNDTLADLGKQETIDNLKLGDVLDIKSEEESSGILWAMKDWHISDLNDQSKIESLTIGAVLNGNATSGIMKAMSTWTIGDLNKQSRIERLKIGQIIEIDGSSSGLMKAMKDWRISDLTDQKKIDSLTLGDVITIGEDGPQMLKALQNMTLGEISTSIDTLTLEDVLGETAFEKDNKILNALRGYQVKELGDAINGLTVEDVFGEEIWSYAKNYNETERPTSTIPKESVETYYYYNEDKDTVLTGGWYTGSEGSYQPVDPSAKIIQGKDQSYVEQKITLTEKIEYYIFDYDNPSNKAPYEGRPEDIKHDDEFSPYYLDEDGNRVDLGEDISYTLEGGDPAPEDIHVRKEVTEGVTSYYYMAKVEVTYRYKTEGGTTYAEDDSNLHVGYRETGTNEEVTAYHAGVWYLLLTGEDGADGAQTKITEMGTLVSKVAEKINTLTLNEMYVHELLSADANPDLDLTPLKTLDITQEDNLKNLTISEVIKLVEDMVNHFNH